MTKKIVEIFDLLTRGKEDDHLALGVLLDERPQKVDFVLQNKKM